METRLYSFYSCFHGSFSVGLSPFTSFQFYFEAPKVEHVVAAATRLKARGEVIECERDST